MKKILFLLVEVPALLKARGPWFLNPSMAAGRTHFGIRGNSLTLLAKCVFGNQQKRNHIYVQVYMNLPDWFYSLNLNWQRRGWVWIFVSI